MSKSLRLMFFFLVLCFGPAINNISNSQVTSELLHLLQFVAEDHVVTLKLKVSNKLFLLKHQREPHTIISPHLTERDFVTFEPLGPHF